jgi:hypothetical protein
MRKKHYLLLMALFLLLIGIGWAVWYEDLDFYQPDSSLRCPMAPADRKVERFIAFGDWGSGSPTQMELADAMARENKRSPFQSVLLLGDNIYPEGDVLKRGKAYFETPYKPLRDAGVRFIAALGNHDTKHQRFLEDQLRYFHMPGQYYRVSQGNIDFFILNTNHFVHGPEQQVWLRKALSQSRARWKIVVGHHPLYASGRNGSTIGLRQVLEPLLAKYHVDLYLSGHDHDYERLKPIRGVHYIVSGGGGAYLTQFRKIIPESLVRIQTHHFLLLEVGSNNIWVRAINEYDQPIDCIHWTKR